MENKKEKKPLQIKAWYWGFGEVVFDENDKENMDRMIQNFNTPLGSSEEEEVDYYIVKENGEEEYLNSWPYVPDDEEE